MPRPAKRYPLPQPCDRCGDTRTNPQCHKCRWHVPQRPVEEVVAEQEILELGE